jgi:DNA-binding response OmpR family regulator
VNKQYRILIAEDDRQLAELTKINFQSEQFIVRTCNNGLDALKAIEEDRPDLILLDVVMPGMDGWETLLKLKSNIKTSTIPVIMCTIKDSLIDVEKSFHYGAQAYIIKPIVFKALLKKVAAVLNIESYLYE